MDNIANLSITLNAEIVPVQHTQTDLYLTFSNYFFCAVNNKLHIKLEGNFMGSVFYLFIFCAGKKLHIEIKAHTFALSLSCQILWLNRFHITMNNLFTGNILSE